jgi:hypothetical protein
MTMGVVRDIFDVFMQMRKLKDDKRKDFFSSVVVKTYDQLRNVHDDFLSTLRDCLELTETSDDVQDIIKHIQKSRLKLQALRSEIYEKSRAYDDVPSDNRDLVTRTNEQENIDIKEFLLACREYFERNSVYMHELKNTIRTLEEGTDRLIALEHAGSDGIASRRREIAIADCNASTFHTRNIIGQSLEELSNRWQKVSKMFAAVHKHFV